jgi:hypothetical protein
MDIAALILSICAILVSCTTLVIYLAKNVFSSHVVQMVPADSFAPNMPRGKPMGDPFDEFDSPQALDSAMDAATKNRTIHSA